MENEIGSIEIGKRADFTVLDKFMVIKDGNVGYKR